MIETPLGVATPLLKLFGVCNMEFTQDQIEDIVLEARQAAYMASDKFLKEVLGGRDYYPCGFAWVSIYGIKGNTKLGKMFKAAGVEKSYDKTYQIWNPSGFSVQSVDVLEAGARAAAEVFTKHGFRAYSGSRLD